MKAAFSRPQQQRTCRCCQFYQRGSKTNNHVGISIFGGQPHRKISPMNKNIDKIIGFIWRVYDCFLSYGESMRTMRNARNMVGNIQPRWSGVVYSWRGHLSLPLWLRCCVFPGRGLFFWTWPFCKKASFDHLCSISTAQAGFNPKLIAISN